MTELEKKCRSYAHRYCRKRGKLNHVDDLTNFLILNKGEFKKERSADFFRELEGRYGTNKYKFYNKQKSLNDTPQIEQISFQDHSWMLWDEVKKLPRNERVMMFLHYKYGLDLLEIAELYDQTEGRISQIISGAEKTLQRRMEEETRRPQSRTRNELLSEEQGENSFEASENLQ